MSKEILKITDATNASNVEWDKYWENSPYSTYFHSREWSEIWGQYTEGKYQPRSEILNFSDGSSVLLPLTIEKKKSGFRVHSSPAGTYGGWINNDNITPKHGQLIFNYLQRSFEDIILRINPLNPIQKNCSIGTKKSDFTHLINLSLDFNNITKNWSKGHISAAKKAQKHGLIIQIAKTIEAWEEYYSIYVKSIKRWGESTSSKYDWIFFNSLFNQNSKNIKLFTANLDNNMIAGGIFCYSPSHTVYWHGAALEEYFNYRPVHLIIYNSLKYSCEHNHDWFDFNPSGGHKGVEKFKSHFGTEKQLASVHHYRSLNVKMKSKLEKIFP